VAREHEVEWLAELVESAHDAIVGMDVDGLITSWNRGASETFGYLRAEALGRSLHDLLVPPDMEESSRRLYAQVAAGKALKNLESVRRCRDGRLIHVRLTLSPVRDRAGSVVGISSITSDVSEKKRAEERFRVAVESSPSAILLVDRQGHIVFANSRSSELFGYSREELLGHTVDFLTPRSVRPIHEELRESYFADPTVRRIGAGRDLWGVRKDGTVVPVEIGLNPVRTEEGILVLASISDISERKRAEERQRAIAAELARSNADLEQFAYVASHDLQEPLRTITSFLDLLERRQEPHLDARSREYIAFARDGAARLHGLVDGLLRYSRVGAEELELSTFPSEGAARQAVANLQEAMRESGAVVALGELPALESCFPQLVLLFQNLLGNALKFRGATAPRVEVSAELRASDWVFRVKDNGIGIDLRFAERIFGMFERLNPLEEYAGAGIGLTLCKRTVERLGGTIWLERSDASGSTFAFSLPRGADESGSEA
jgi:PAS domain S-box-containing protein